MITQETLNNYIENEASDAVKKIFNILGELTERIDEVEDSLKLWYRFLYYFRIKTRTVVLLLDLEEEEGKLYQYLMPLLKEENPSIYQAIMQTKAEVLAKKLFYLMF